MGRTFDETERLFGNAALGFLLLFGCSVLGLGVVAVLVGSGSPAGLLRVVALVALAGLFVAVAGIGLTSLTFGLWAYRQARRLRESIAVPAQTAVGNPLWLLFVLFESRGALNEYEWWIRRAWRWSLFGVGWLVVAFALGR